MQPLRKKARCSPKPISRKAEMAQECLSTLLLSDLADIVLAYFGSGLEGRHVDTFALETEESVADLVAMDGALFARLSGQKIVQINPWTKSVVCVLLEAWRGGHTTFTRMTAMDKLLFVTTPYHSKIIICSIEDRSVVYKEFLPLLATVEQLKAYDGKLFVLFNKDDKLYFRVYSTTTFEILCQKEWPFHISPPVDAMAVAGDRILYTRYNRKCLYFWNWAKGDPSPEQCFVGPFQEETLTVNASGIVVLGTQEVAISGLIQPVPRVSWKSILQLFPVQDPLEPHFIWSSNFDEGELTHLCFDGDKLYAVMNSSNQIAVFV